MVCKERRISPKALGQGSNLTQFAFQKGHSTEVQRGELADTKKLQTYSPRT